MILFNSPFLNNYSSKCDEVIQRMIIFIILFILLITFTKCLFVFHQERQIFFFIFEIFFKKMAVNTHNFFLLYSHNYPTNILVLNIIFKQRILKCSTSQLLDFKKVYRSLKFAIIKSQ
jgi:hypothetical protein